MTSATTVAGAAAMVFFSDPEATIWNALGFTLVGGVVSSTFLVLTVTPALYKLFEQST
jgi:multidrug efflux pump subunit AcrB